MIIPLDDAAFVEAMAHKPEVDMGYLPIRVEDRDRLVALARVGLSADYHGMCVDAEDYNALYHRLADAEARVWEVEEALSWYQEKADALVRYGATGKARAIEAVIVELTGDGGKRAALTRRTT